MKQAAAFAYGDGWATSEGLADIAEALSQQSQIIGVKGEGVVYSNFEGTPEPGEIARAEGGQIKLTQKFYSDSLVGKGVNITDERAFIMVHESAHLNGRPPEGGNWYGPSGVSYLKQTFSNQPYALFFINADSFSCFVIPARCVDR